MRGRLSSSSLGSPELRPNIKKAENMNFARHNMPEPEVYVGHIIIADELSIEREIAFLKGRASAEDQQMVHQAPEILHRHLLIWVAAPHTQARGGFPEVAPSAGEHASADGLRRRQEAKDVFKDSIRQ
jgi:hypothetical protein